MIEIVIKLSRDLVEAMSSSSADSDRSDRRLMKLVDDYGAKLSAPTHAVGESAQYFRVEGVAPEDGESLRRDLERLDGIEAAYIKPSDALP